MADAPRIVIALDPSAPEASAFDVLRYFHALDVDLAGVFVEDTKLLSYSRSSLAREIVAGAERELAADSIERQLRARSADMRRYFESMTRVLHGRHSFHVARGEVVSEIERVATNCELLVVGVGHAHRGLRARWGADVYRLARARAATTVFTRDLTPARQVVTVLLRTAGDVAAVAPAALRIARASRARLRVLIVADGAGVLDATRERAAAAFAEFEAARYDVVADRTAATLERAVGTAEGCTLVLAASDEEADTDLLRDLLAQTAWNLVLVRAVD